MRIISRDSFARQELVRENYYKYTGLHGGHECDYCGRQSEVNRHYQRKLYKYAIISDDSGHINYIKGKFCSISCMRSYNS